MVGYTTIQSSLDGPWSGIRARCGQGVSPARGSAGRCACIRQLMSQVDKLQDAEEHVAQMREEAAKTAREEREEDLRRAPLADTATKAHTSVTAPLSQVRTMVNMRTGALPDLHELAVSIKETGLLHPPLVRATGDDDVPYELLAGRRRFGAMGADRGGRGAARGRLALHAGGRHLQARGADDAVRRELPPGQAGAGPVRARRAGDHGRGPVADRRRGLAAGRRAAGLDAQVAQAARPAGVGGQARRGGRPVLHGRRRRAARHRAR